MTAPTPTAQASLQPYPEYRPSGVAHLGDVPAHWGVSQAKHQYSIQLGKMIQNHPSHPTDVEVPYLKALNVQWASVDTSDVRSMWASQREIEKYGVKNGDLLVCEGGEGGRCAIVGETPQNCIIQNALHRVRPLGNNNNAYLQYTLTAIAQTGWFESTNSKATIAHFTAEKFGSLRIPVPPPEEQAAIARWLDAALGRIRRLRAAKARTLELLGEYRRAAIHEAVTRGLDPGAPLRASGAAHLGDVPAHWDVRRLKHWVGINERTLSETTDPSFEFRYIEIGGVGVGTLVDEPACIRFAAAPSRARRVVRAGDTIISTVRTYLKAVWFAENVNDATICSTGFATLTPWAGTEPKFVSYLAQSDFFTDRVTVESEGIAYPAISESKFRSIHVPVPPPEEQAAIAAHLDWATAGIDAAADRARREVALLDEYGAGLVAAAVTGQVDVRGAGALG